jgi:hypothetical protein
MPSPPKNAHHADGRRLIKTFGLANMTESSLGCRSGLYPRLLGNSWQSLDDAVQRLHALGKSVHAVGVFRVRRGTNLLARTLATLARLPSAGEAIDIRLLVTAAGDSEKWQRSFAGRPLVSLQSERTHGVLAERMGPVEMRFRLQVVEGALSYRTTSAALCLGSLSVPVPRWFSPSVRALERPVGEEGQIDVGVEVHLPLLGCLIAYDGTLTHVEAQE